jgi:hypothetical protein
LVVDSNIFRSLHRQGNPWHRTLGTEQRNKNTTDALKIDEDCERQFEKLPKNHWIKLVNYSLIIIDYLFMLSEFTVNAFKVVVFKVGCLKNCSRQLGFFKLFKGWKFHGNISFKFLKIFGAPCIL